MKKRIIILIFLMCGTILSQNWVPFEVGNKWQFLKTTDYQNYPYIYYEITFGEVVSDTIINNKTYYKYDSDFMHDLLRYDSQENKLYSYSIYSNSERLEMDFNLSQGDTVPGWSFHRTVLEGNDNLFGETIYYKGYYTYPGGAFVNYDINRFVNDLGRYYIHREEWIPGLTNDDVYYHLLQAIIIRNDSVKYYSHNYYPEIIFQPDTLASDSVFSINFEVDDVYSRMEVPPWNDTTLFSFIDTVIMESYYSNGDSTVNNLPVGANQITNTKEYELNTLLNMGLLQNGFNYFYRIKAKDKSMIPHYSFSPDTGFYHLKFDTVTSVNIENPVISQYLLYQNYPNPFNPQTIISYAIPKRSFVQLNIYDVLGNKVANLVNEEKQAGKYSVNFNGSGLASGIYFYQLYSGKVTISRKMILIK